MSGDPTLDTIAVRLGLSFLAAFVLGWDREELGHPAGLRTMVLICTASTIRPGDEAGRSRDACIVSMTRSRRPAACSL